MALSYLVWGLVRDFFFSILRSTKINIAKFNTILKTTKKRRYSSNEACPENILLVCEINQKIAIILTKLVMIPEIKIIKKKEK